MIEARLLAPATYTIPRSYLTKHELPNKVSDAIWLAVKQGRSVKLHTQKGIIITVPRHIFADLRAIYRNAPKLQRVDIEEYGEYETVYDATPENNEQE